MKVGDLVRFCDYDLDYEMRIGIIVDISNTPHNSDRITTAIPVAYVAYGGRIQPIPIPQLGQDWMELVCESR